MQEDTSLVQQTLDGDGQAFHRLIMKYYTAIYALIMSWVKNTEDAKDLTQETFLKAYQELGSLKHPEQFRLWLRQIAKHKCQNWLRKKQELFVPLDDDMICEMPSADEVLILRETLAKMMKAIDELPELESQLLKERYLDDASYDELEAKHGLSQSVLAMRLLRARRKVKDQLGKTLSAFVAFFHGHTESILTGGMEIVKLSIKTKLISGGILLLLVLGGTGISIWYHQKSQQALLSQNMQIKPSDSNSTFSKKSISINDIKMVSDSQNNTVELSKEAIAQQNPILTKKSDMTTQQEPNSIYKAENIESRKEIYNGMTKEEIEAAISVLEPEVREKLTRAVSLYKELINVTQSNKIEISSELDQWCRKTDAEVKKLFFDLSRSSLPSKLSLYRGYALALGRDDPFAKGGWANELQDQLPFRVDFHDN